MKIAQIMAGSPQGGAERFFERHCAALAQAGHDVLPIIRADPARERRLHEAGLAVETAWFGGALDLVTRGRLRRRLEAFRPVLVIAWMGRAATHAPGGPWHLAGRLGGYYDLGRFRRCDCLIGNTRGIVDHMIASGADPRRVVHLPNFAEDLADAAPRPLGLPTGPRTLVALGRLHRNKGFDTLLDAMALLPAAQLALIGDGPERAALQARIAALGLGARVLMPGWQEDVAGVLAAADVLVVPSRQEVLGNVVIEGFSAALPVVAAASAGPAELIEDGVNGLLVPVDDAGALAGAIGRVLADERLAKRMAASGRASFEREHARAPVMARWEAFLTSLV